MASPSDVLTLHTGAASGAGAATGVDVTLPATGKTAVVVRTAAFVTLQVTVPTAALRLTLETSPNGSTGWRKVGEMRAGTTADEEELAVDGLDTCLRASWPAATDATFTLTAVAHQLLTRRSDLYAKLSRDVCAETERLEPGIIARALIVATDVVVGPFGAWRDIDCMVSRFGISAGPLAEVELTLDYKDVPRSISDAVASIAAKLVFDRHGHIGGGVDELIVAADLDARKWLLGLSEAGASSSSAGAAGVGATAWRWSMQHARR